MKSSINLNARWKGPWANFESHLMKEQNVGFIEWKNRNIFRLKYTPFSEHYSPYFYAAPEGSEIPEQGLIRVMPGDLVKDAVFPSDSMVGQYSRQTYIVESYETINVNSLPKPSITKDEFLYYAVDSWHGADNFPLFQKELAYNLLSCQKDFFGIGGIGVETFAPAGSSRTLKYLKSSIHSLLPDQFKKQNDTFEYHIIQKEGEAKITYQRRNDPYSHEVSFNDMSRLSDQVKVAKIGIQIPLILPTDVSYRPREYFNRDLMDYQMRALLIRPIIKPSDIEKFADLALQTSDYIHKKYTEETIALDSMAHLKIACAACRLELKDELPEDYLPSIKAELLEMFKEYADTYRDQLIGGGKARWTIPMQPFSPRQNLSIDANKVYHELLDLDQHTKEIGLTWIAIEELKKRPAMKFLSDFSLEKALTEVNNANLILLRKNQSEILVVHHEV